MNRTLFILLTAALFITACDDVDPEPGMRDCGLVEVESSCGGQEPDVCAPPQCPGGALQTADCAEDDPDCVEVDDGCGDVIFCQAEALPCDMGWTIGAPVECPRDDPRCVDVRRLDHSRAQCLAPGCAEAIEGVLSPDCPDDPRVRACAEGEACPEAQLWCGQRWPGCIEDAEAD